MHILLGYLFLFISSSGVMAGKKGLVKIRLDSPVTKHIICGKPIHIKRDDLLNVHGLSGNKARKYLKLLRDVVVDEGTNIPECYNQYHQCHPYHLVSYGGIQSNSMLALSQIAQLNQKYNFTYFSRKIPRFLKKTPIGNYQRALQWYISSKWCYGG